VVPEHIGEVRWCYNEILEDAPTASGHMNVNFTIEADGSVTRAKVTQSDLPPSMSACIVQAVSGWTFPVPQGAASQVIDYPFEFQPG
jgi:TonB family protein